MRLSIKVKLGMMCVVVCMIEGFHSKAFAFYFRKQFRATVKIKDVMTACGHENDSLTHIPRTMLQCQ